MRVGGQYVFVMRDGDPQMYQEAMHSVHAKEWEKAMVVEFEQLHTSGTFEWVPKVPDGQKAIRSWIIFQMKHDGNGKVVRYKAQVPR